MCCAVSLTRNRSMRAHRRARARKGAMGLFILRRLLLTLPVMAVVALFVFSLLYVAPGDPATMIAGDQATPAEVERIRVSLGLDQPFAIRFGAWAFGALQGNLGNSLFSGQSVVSM